MNMNTLEILKKHHDESLNECWNEIETSIKSDTNIMDGLPVFTGTRIPVYIVLDYLSEGYKPSDIIKDYPSLDEQKIRAALKFAQMLSSLH